MQEKYYYLYPSFKRFDDGRIIKYKRVLPLITSRNIKYLEYESLGKHKNLKSAIQAAVDLNYIYFDLESNCYRFTKIGAIWFM